MTVTGGPTRPLPAEGGTATRPSRRRDGLAVREICPYLVADEGTWRSAYAAREHRCGAVRPPAALAVSKQRQLCLVDAHGGCATFLAARAVAEESALLAPGDDGAGLWQGPGTAPVILEPTRRIGALPTASAKSGGSALLVGLMVVAFLVLILARTQSPAGLAAATVAPSLAVVAATTAAPASTPVPSVTDAPSAAPEASPAVTEAPTARAASAEPATPEPRRYRVKPGDTLISIAARFDSTVRRIQAANGIADPRSLTIGQVLLIP